MAALTLDQLEASVRFRGDYQNVRKFPQANVRGEIHFTTTVMSSDAIRPPS